jgi:hypothetical protein
MLHPHLTAFSLALAILDTVGIFFRDGLTMIAAKGKLVIVVVTGCAVAEHTAEKV